MHSSMLGFVFLILLVITASCGIADIRIASSPTPKPRTHREQIEDFARVILAIETERDRIVVAYQKLTANMMDMSTRDVFASIDELVDEQTKLQTKMVRVGTATAEIAAVHGTFSVAYTTELEAYKTLESSARSGDLTGMYASISGIIKADDMYRNAYDQLDELLASVGLSREDFQ